MKIDTLKSSPEFQRIAKSGRRVNASAFIMQIVKTSPEKSFRLGLTASRKVGDAVLRNRAKRRLREIVRLFGVENLSGHEIVLIAKTAAATRDFSRMQKEFAAGVQATGAVDKAAST